MHDVDHAAQRIGAVQHARRSSDHLDALRVGRFDVGAVLVTPLLRLESLTIIQHEDAIGRETPDHRLADPDARTEAVNPGDAIERLTKARRLRGTQLVTRDDAGRLR